MQLYASLCESGLRLPDGIEGVKVAVEIHFEEGALQAGDQLQALTKNQKNPTVKSGWWKALANLHRRDGSIPASLTMLDNAW